MVDLTPLYDLIGLYEADKAAPRQGVENGYEVVSSHTKIPLPKPLTRMTVREVREFQRQSIRAGALSSAMGRFQFIRATLGDVVENLPHGLDTIFNAENQKLCARARMEYRGLSDFLAGAMSLEAFGNNLAREWASLPVLTTTRGEHRQVTRGQSYYAGDGLNKAHASPREVETVLRGLLAVPETPVELSVDAAANLQQQIDQINAKLAAIHGATG